MVTVVDAASLVRDFASHDLLRDRGEAVGDEDERTIVDLIVEQIEFADVVVVNKVSDVADAERMHVRHVIAALNADARVVEVDFGAVDLAAVLDTGLFDEAKAQRHPLWYRELYGAGDHVPETAEYGIESFVYRARQPFHPERFGAFLQRTWPGLLRAKGHFWTVTRPAWAAEMSLAGGLVRTRGLGQWWAALDRKKWPDDPDFRRTLDKVWHPDWGDRRQELVFIGTDIDEAAIRAALDDCLVAPAAVPKHLRDPFPAWEDAYA